MVVVAFLDVQCQHAEIIHSHACKWMDAEESEFFPGAIDVLKGIADGPLAAKLCRLVGEMAADEVPVDGL